MSKCGVFSGPYFPVFGLNVEIYEVNLRIQSECRKIRTRNNSVFGLFSGSVEENLFVNAEWSPVKNASFSVRKNDTHRDYITL